jgi:2-polyprenyl-3-methyl-5-hydroxy-6-metoxy-1,4-benzoquinol methylase
MNKKVINQEYIQKSKKYYNEKFGSFEKNRILTWEEQLRLDIIKNTRESYLRMENTERRRSILDFGCGNGWLSSALSSYGKVTGVDLSNESIEKARINYPNVRFHVFDVTDENTVNSLGEDMFDIIVSSEVVEHVLDQKKYFRNIEQLLKKNSALLILTTPNEQWKKNFFHGTRKEWAQPYEFWLKKNDIKAQIARDFKKIDVKTFGSQFFSRFRSYGLIHYVTNPYMSKMFSILRLNKIYYKLLDRLGFGLYLLCIAKR